MEAHDIRAKKLIKNEMIKNIRVLVCGHPNVGKTLLINRITGAMFKVGNFPGVTIEKSEINIKYDNTIITFIDIPGFYNTNPFSQDEQIAIDFIKNHQNEYDILLCVGNSLHLDKALLFLKGIEEISTKPKIVAMNLSENAKRHGISIDTNLLQEKIGYKTISVDAKENKNIAEIPKAIISTNKLHPKEFDTKETVDQCITKSKIPIFNAYKISKAIDSIVLNKIFGMPIFLGIMFSVFALTFWLGNMPSDFLEGSFTLYILELGNKLPKNIIHSIFFQGIIPGVISAISFLPRIIILFFCISILEKTGYMARISFIMDGILRIFSINGKSAIPLMSGFGCSIPAYMSARILNNKYQKLATMFAIGFIPCSAKMTVLILLVAAFFPANIAPFIMFALYITGLLLGLIMAFLLSLSMKDEKGKYNNLLVMDLPEYRVPGISVIKSDVMPKVVSYIKNAGTMIAVISFVLWLLCNLPYNPIDSKYWEQRKILNTSTSTTEQMTEAKEYLLLNSMAGEIGKISGIIFEPLGFDWRMNISLIAAIAAKEVALSTLGVLYQVDFDESEQSELLLTGRLQASIPFASGISFMIFMFIYTPCISAITVFHRESNSKKYTILVVVSTTILAWLLSFIGYNICIMLNL